MRVVQDRGSGEEHGDDENGGQGVYGGRQGTRDETAIVGEALASQRAAESPETDVYQPLFPFFEIRTVCYDKITTIYRLIDQCNCSCKLPGTRVLASAR